MKTFNPILVIIVAFTLTLGMSIAQPTATTNVDINITVMPNSKLLFGITMDSRTGMTGTNGQVGYFNTDGTLISEVEPLFGDFPVSSLRYPGNGIGSGFNWKKSIGLPASSRPHQNILGGLGASQAVEFGFDEFMAWTAAKGVKPSDVHIMLPIYDSAIIWPDPIQQRQAMPNIIQYCADWVEYTNAVNDGSNPGGGIDWAALRAANGHNAPYGIKLWNMGNEPWASHEFGASVAGCKSYLSLISPIIDAMLAIDPTIHITLATVGTNIGVQTWHSTILNSPLVASGKIYGISPHAFPVESGLQTKVSKFVSIYTALADSAKNHDLKIILGDYAQGIPQTNPTQSEKDIAMQWEGTILSVDFILGMSKINNLERVNFWVYGMPSAVWHPIRKLNGLFTLMPVARMYKMLYPLSLDYSVITTNTSETGNDANPYSVNTSAFATNDKLKLNIISVNRELLKTHELQVNGISGYNIVRARILSATSPSDETFTEKIINQNSNGYFSIPPSSVLIIEYAKNQPQLPDKPILALPMNNSTTIKLNTTLSWNPTNAAEFYKVQLSTTADFANPILDNTSDSLTQNLSGLSDGIRYYWRVQASNTFGASPWSEVWNFTTEKQIIAPLSPMLTLPQNAAQHVEFSGKMEWSSVIDATAYHAQLSINNNFSTTIYDQSNLLQTSLNFDGLDASTKYYWRVRASNSAGISSWSEVRSFTTKFANSVESSEIDDDIALRITPNPIVNSGFITVNLPKVGACSLGLFDEAGRQVSIVSDGVREAGEFSVPFPKVPSGVYAIKLQFRKNSKLIIVPVVR